MPKTANLALQNTLRNDLAERVGQFDSLRAWLEAYFAVEVTTADSSRKVQRRDLGLLIEFLESETGQDCLDDWTPRFSRSLLNFMRNALKTDGSRQWDDRTINRVIAHLKTFSKWIHRHRTLCLGNPMAKIKAVSTTSLLSVERALTDSERRRILDAADLLLEMGGRSKHRNRHRNGPRPLHKNLRPDRNRAIMYCLIETGMRRQR